MIVANERFDLNKDQHNSFCLNVVTHPGSNSARAGLTSELVCLPLLSFAKIPFLSINLEFYFNRAYSSKPTNYNKSQHSLPFSNLVNEMYTLIWYLQVLRAMSR